MLFLYSKGLLELGLFPFYHSLYGYSLLLIISSFVSSAHGWSQKSQIYRNVRKRACEARTNGSVICLSVSGSNVRARCYFLQSLSLGTNVLLVFFFQAYGETFVYLGLSQEIYTWYFRLGPHFGLSLLLNGFIISMIFKYKTRVFRNWVM